MFTLETYGVEPFRSELVVLKLFQSKRVVLKPYRMVTVLTGRFTNNVQ